MDVSIIIVNYNTEKLILDCIQSIFEKTEGISFEIIIVDNASPNEPSILKKDNRIKYIQSETNIGFGRANNLGAKYAKGNFLHLLNPDTILINNAIYVLWDYLRQHPNVGIAGSNLYQKDLTPNHSYELRDPGVLQEFILPHFFRKEKRKDFNYTNTPQQVSYTTGASMMLKKEIFNQLKGFDEDFFMYYEETYLCYLARKKGYLIMNIPQSKIIHFEGQSFTLKENRENLFFKSRKIYLIKRHNRIYYHLCNFIYFLNIIAAIVYFFFTRKKEVTEIWKYRMTLLFKD